MLTTHKLDTYKYLKPHMYVCMYIFVCMYPLPLDYDRPGVVIKNVSQTKLVLWLPAFREANL